MGSLEELKKYIKDLKDISINKSKDIKSNKKKMLCEQIDFITLVLEKDIANSLKALDMLKLILKNKFKIEFKEEVNALGHLNRDMFINGKIIVTDLYTYELLKKELENGK